MPFNLTDATQQRTMVSSRKELGYVGFKKASPHRYSRKLAEVKEVFSIGALAFEGDLPASIFHMNLIEDDIDTWDARSEIIAVFHTNAGHVTLHDDAYNSDRNIGTGNPYKELIAGLQKRGVQIELCGATAKFTIGGNADLLPASK